jgi:hypothetical protein
MSKASQAREIVAKAKSGTESPIGRIAFTKKEIAMAVIATALGIGGIRADDPWIVGTMLAVSWCAFIYICKIHRGSMFPRVVCGLIITAIFLSIGVRVFWSSRPEVTAIERQVSVAFLFKNHQIEINNLGKTGLELWGTKLDKGQLAIETSPIIIPVQPFNYHIKADTLEKELYDKIGQNGEMRFPFYIFVKDTAGRKYTVECGMWAVIKQGELTLETQGHPPVEGWLEK